MPDPILAFQQNSHIRAHFFAGDPIRLPQPLNSRPKCIRPSLRPNSGTAASESSRTTPFSHITPRGHDLSGAHNQVLDVLLNHILLPARGQDSLPVAPPSAAFLRYLSSSHTHCRKRGATIPLLSLTRKAVRLKTEPEITTKLPTTPGS